MILVDDGLELSQSLPLIHPVQSPDLHSLQHFDWFESEVQVKYLSASPLAMKVSMISGTVSVRYPAKAENLSS